MQKAILDVHFSELKQNPILNKGRLFVIGGIIAKTTITKEGSLIEAIYVPVNSRGYLKDVTATNERFLALYRGEELLDPLVYQEKREVTIAGEFIEMRRGRIGEMEYSYPFFEIKEIYLWPEEREINRRYYMGPPYPFLFYRYRPYDPWYDPWWYDPWRR
ncbi:MAG: Slp family lipoprotein [Nitrospirae bacterium]|nr:Slp family lipoprotein [Nitrospirota bacterium]